MDTILDSNFVETVHQLHQTMIFPFAKVKGQRTTFYRFQQTSESPVLSTQNTCSESKANTGPGQQIPSHRNSLMPSTSVPRQQGTMPADISALPVQILLSIPFAPNLSLLLTVAYCKRHQDQLWLYRVFLSSRTFPNIVFFLIISLGQVCLT